jgi:hypothetical protein
MQEYQAHEQAWQLGTKLGIDLAQQSHVEEVRLDRCGRLIAGEPSVLSYRGAQSFREGQVVPKDDLATVRQGGFLADLEEVEKLPLGVGHDLLRLALLDMEVGGSAEELHHPEEVQAGGGLPGA